MGFFFLLCFASVWSPELTSGVLGPSPVPDASSLSLRPEVTFSKYDRIGQHMGSLQAGGAN